MRAQGSIKIFLIFGIVIAIFVVGFWFIGLVLPVIPHPANSPINTTAPSTYLYKFATGFIDKSIIVALFFVLVIDIIGSWRKPNKALAIANIIGLFLLGYIGGFFQTIATSVGSAFNANIILPQSFTLITSPYILTIFYFFCIFSIILNLRSKGK